MELYEALKEPRRVAVLKCKGHSKGKGLIERGNEAADHAAKETAGYYENDGNMMVLVEDPLPELNIEQILDHQNRAAPEEKSVWKDRGASSDDKGL